MSPAKATFRQWGFFSTFSEFSRNNCHFSRNLVCNILNEYSMTSDSIYFPKNRGSDGHIQIISWLLLDSLLILSVCISISPALAVSLLCPPSKKKSAKTLDSIVFTILGKKKAKAVLKNKNNFWNKIKKAHASSLKFFEQCN